MDLLTKQGAQLAPKDTAEAVAIFRAQVIGPLLTRAFASHGDLASAIRALSRERYRPPNSSTTRAYSEATIERWYYRFKKRGLRADPAVPPDVGHARESSRRSASACARSVAASTTSAALRTLELDGRFAKGAVSLSTAASLPRQGLDRSRCASRTVECA
jgi:hypothetical protein